MVYKRDYLRTAKQIAEFLEGTCDSLTKALAQWDMEDAEDDIEFCRDLDSHAFCCDKCGWWFFNSEEADTGKLIPVCVECVTE
ncbi:hypothetical protein PP940_gp152 [Rhizobium phage RL2RES]|uniref:Uncharacterized protein n=1 Tax=Rhizobium phage RL2RES TaxID=103371 RepID=A0A6B9J695_9CAUD|nr:hypothetical protein PP940_gp152 [Rhizobium phage RL2RES]QGZ14295.1 hypothetical protein RL2RES_152 [Rhizobium phage RL2RES]